MSTPTFKKHHHHKLVGECKWFKNACFTMNRVMKIPLSTISVSVALCSTSRILPNHPSPTICRISNSSIKCTWGNLESKEKTNKFYLFLILSSRRFFSTFECKILLSSWAHRQIFTFSNSNSRILWMWRFDRLEPEDSLLDDDDEWLDDAIAIV